MNLFPQHITLNGSVIKLSEILGNHSVKNEWEKEFIEFLSDWYNAKDSITVNTSGSTGTPKTIELKKTFVAASALRTLIFFNLKEGDKVLHGLPSRFIAGKLMVVRALLGKLDLYLVNPASKFEILNNVNFKFAAMVPNQVSKILNLHVNLNKLENLLIGGAAISNKLETTLQKISAKCYSSYGMTETATHIALRRINGKNAESFYHSLNGIRVKLSNKGCLQITMPGREKPFQTTDLADLKNSTTFQILGRSDNVIISGGIKYSPETIEKKLEAHIHHPFMISSLPQQELGQQIILLVEGAESNKSKKEIISICEKQLTKFECPRQVLFVDQLSRTKNGKLKR